MKNTTKIGNVECSINVYIVTDGPDTGAIKYLWRATLETESSYLGVQLRYQDYCVSERGTEPSALAARKVCEYAAEKMNVKMTRLREGIAAALEDSRVWP